MTQAQKLHSKMLPLQGKQFAVPASAQSGFANQLLADLGAITPAATTIDVVAAQMAWAKSGAMALTGKADGPPLTTPAPLAACLQGAYEALQTLASKPNIMDITGLLGERAAIAKLQRQGATSPGGSCKILATADGHVALNLARDDDWSLIPALLKGAEASNWPELIKAMASQQCAEICEQGNLLGLAITPAAGEPCKRNWFEITSRGKQKLSVSQKPPLVLDLSSLWAGPLCSHLLQQLGARVIKVESINRPDGARYGPAEFFDLLNANKQCVALDLNSALGIEQLLALIKQADIVIESSRPRALQQMGISAEALVESQPGLSWISLTGYGRAPQQALRVAYGDDAGVAAGLSAQLQHCWGEPLFCADAIGDPLAGMHAALAAMACWRSGGGFLVDISLQAVLNHCIGTATAPCGEIIQTAKGWQLCLDSQEIAVAAPRARAVTKSAKALGADTELICHELGLPC